MPLFCANKAMGVAVKIEASHEQIGTKVWIDGVLINQVKSVRLFHNSGEVSRLELELYPSSIEVVGEVTALAVAEVGE